MPFINDQLAHNEEVNERERAKCRAARTSRYVFNLETTMLLLRSRIVGQDHILDELERCLITIKADFLEQTKPLAVVLFIGPTGVGKTEIVKVLAEAIHGDVQQLCRIDMNTLAQAHYSAALTGSPPGYVGSKESQTLFDVETIKGSYSRPGIVLFDEVEKADRDVVRAIMNIFDTGKLSLSSGSQVVDFSNSIIFMTSNLGIKAFLDQQQKYLSGWRKMIGLRMNNKRDVLKKALSHHFDLEFLNRIDYTHFFNALDRRHQHKILELELDKLNHRLAKKNAQLEFGEPVLDYLSRHYDERFGAREIRRALRKELEPKLAKVMLKYLDCEVFSAQIENKKLVVKPR